MQKSLDRKSGNHSTVHWDVYNGSVAYTKSIDMLGKNTPGVKKSEAKLEAPVSSYSYIRLKSVISGGGQLRPLILAMTCLIIAMHVLYSKAMN